MNTVKEAQEVLKAFDVSMQKEQHRVDKPDMESRRFLVAYSQDTMTIHSIEFHRASEKEVLHRQDLAFLLQLLTHLQKQGYDAELFLAEKY